MRYKGRYIRRTYSPRYRYRERHVSKEQFLQEQIAAWLNSLGVLYCASAGGMRTNLKTAAKMKRAGYKKGFPDIFIYEPRGAYHGLSIENKVNNYPEPEQQAWQEELTKRGYKALIMPANLKTFEDHMAWFKKQVCDYLGIKEC